MSLRENDGARHTRSVSEVTHTSLRGTDETIEREGLYLTVTMVGTRIVKYIVFLLLGRRA